VTIVLTMIDEASTPRAFRHCALLVRDHITSNVEPDLNGVLVNALVLRAVTLIAEGQACVTSDMIGVCKDALNTHRTDPPPQVSQALTVGALR
jgi:hypothetical protein